MKKVLLISIHPKFVEKILTGEKRFEFRKHIPSCEISHLLIHATAPEKHLVAIVEIEQILQAPPSVLWEQTKYAAGISRSFFREYFYGSKIASAFQLGRVFPIPEDVAQQIAYLPPQSYSYFKDQGSIKRLEQVMNHDIASKVIFIGGIHGVGKTCFRNKFLRPAGWYGISASEIIKQKSGEVNSNKRVTKVKSNQELLKEGLVTIKQNFYKVALDGHFSLINVTGEVTLVPEDIFTEIKPSVIIILTAPIDIIQSHLYKRDNQKYSRRFISSFQKKEIKYAKKIAKLLCIPMIVIDSTEQVALLQRKLNLFLLSFCSSSRHFDYHG